MRSARNESFFMKDKAAQRLSKNIPSLVEHSRETGTLNLSNQNIDTLPDLFDTELYPINKFWEVQHLLKLDISHNKFNMLDTSMYLCYEHLQTLLCRGNNISIININNINALYNLDISSNELECIDDEFTSKLFLIKTLYCNDNRINYISSLISNCTSIIELNLSNNKISTIPGSIGSISTLKKLLISNNIISTLPSSINHLTNLELLDLSKNKINCLLNFDALLNLIILSCNENQLIQSPLLPSTKSKLSILQLNFNKISILNIDFLSGCYDTLSELHIASNCLINLPPSLHKFQSLRVLDVSNNDVTDIPHEIGYLSNLYRIAIEGNPIRSIRRSILTQSTDELKKYLRTRGASPNQTIATADNYDVDINFPINQLALNKARLSINGTLDLSNISMDYFPSHLFDSLGMKYASSFHSINLSYNNLRNFPIELVYLKHLKCLDLSYNKLNELDTDELSNTSLPIILHLAMHGNKITTHPINCILKAILSNSISNSSNKQHSLLSLSASHNLISDLPIQIQYHNSLVELNLSNNKISSLDNIDFSQFSSLDIVNFSLNRLTSIGSLHLAPNISFLSIEQNSFSEIPLEIALMFKLSQLNIHGNPQRSIPHHIIEQGTEAIISILKRRLPVPFKLENDTTLSDRINSDIKISMKHQLEDDILSSQPTERSKPALYYSLNSATKPVSSIYSARPLKDFVDETVQPLNNQAYSEREDLDLVSQLENLASEIARLEFAEDHFSTTQKKRIDIKRELHRKRALFLQLRKR